MKKVFFNGSNERVFKEKSIGQEKKIKVYKPNLLVYLNFYFHHYPCFMTLAFTQSKHGTLATLLTLWTDSLSDLYLVRSGCFQMVYEIVVLKHYARFIVKHMYGGSVQMFFCGFCEFSRTSFLQNASGRLHFPRLDKLYKILVHR